MPYSGKIKKTDFGVVIPNQSSVKSKDIKITPDILNRYRLHFLGASHKLKGQMTEKMDLKKADMGDVIKDFYKSDAPQFKGKSKKKRRDMAIAAKLEAEGKPLNASYNMGEALNSDDKPVIKKISKQLKKSVKAHQKQSDLLSKALVDEAAAAAIPAIARIGAQTFGKTFGKALTSSAAKATAAGALTGAGILAISKGGESNYEKLRKMGEKGEGEDLKQKAEKKLSKKTRKRDVFKKVIDDYKTGLRAGKDVESTSSTGRINIIQQELQKRAEKGDPNAIKQLKKFGKRFKENIKRNRNMDDSVQESVEDMLNIQDWNSDDIRYTEIETVDIIKPKPIKETSSNWREEIDLDEGYKTKLFLKGLKAIKDPIKKVTYTPVKKGFKKLITKANQLRLDLGNTGSTNIPRSVKRLLKGRKLGGKNKPKLGDTQLDLFKNNKDGLNKFKGTSGLDKNTTVTNPTNIQNIQTKSVVNKAKKIANQGTIQKTFNKGTTPVKVDVTKKPDFDKYFSGTTPTKSGGTTNIKQNINYKKGKESIKVNLQDLQNKLKNEKKNIKKKLSDHYDWRADLDDDVLYRLDRFNEDWQKANRKDKTDGMSQKAVNAYKRENPGSKLKTAVTTKPSKLKKGSKASKRRKSFCARSDGQRKMHNIDCSKTPDKRICKARRRWNC